MWMCAACLPFQYWAEQNVEVTSQYCRTTWYANCTLYSEDDLAKAKMQQWQLCTSCAVHASQHLHAAIVINQPSLQPAGAQLFRKWWKVMLFFMSWVSLQHDIGQVMQHENVISLGCSMFSCKQVVLHTNSAHLLQIAYGVIMVCCMWMRDVDIMTNSSCCCSATLYKKAIQWLKSQLCSCLHDVSKLPIICSISQARSEECRGRETNGCQWVTLIRHCVQ